MTQPLATYSEAQIGLKRRFELYEDRVVVRGKKPRMTFETTVMLADLRSVRSKKWIRHWTSRIGVMFIVASVVPFIMFVVLALLRDGSIAAALFLCAGAGIALVGVVICVRTFRLIEWTQFPNHLGQSVLDVARAGPECESYDSFVELLVRQIEGARKVREKLLQDAFAQTVLARQLKSTQVEPYSAEPPRVSRGT